MKLSLALLVASLVAVSHQQSMQKILSEWRKLAAPHMNRCMCEAGVDPSFIEGFFQFGELPNDSCFKCNIKCWGQAIGVVTSSGNVNMTVYRSLFAITDEIVHKCSYNPQVDICQKSYDLLLCTYNIAANTASGNSVPVTPSPVIPQPKQWEGFPQFFYEKQ